MRIQDVIAEAVDASRTQMFRYLAGFDESNRTRQAPTLPNHAAWVLGHCALTMHRVAEKLDAGPLPLDDFVAGAAQGDATRFATESVAFASTPSDQPAHYPSLERSKAIYVAAIERLVAAVRAASDSKLQEVIPWGPVQLPLYQAALRMAMHNGMHIGQLADLRRALGFKSIFS